MGVLLNASGLSYRQGKNGEVLLQNINLTMVTGETVWLRGASASGKSLLVELLAGKIQPAEGIIERHGAVAWVPQQYLVYQDLTASENLEFFSKVNDYQRDLEDLLMLGGLQQYPRLRAGELPMGCRKMLQMCIALTRDADIYLLDEPSVGMDEYQTTILAQMLQGLKESGKGILLTTADNVPALMAAEHTYRLHGGRLIADRNHAVGVGVMEATR